MGNREKQFPIPSSSCSGRVYSRKKSVESSVVDPDPDMDPESGYGS
jgi:hypothetical protein